MMGTEQRSPKVWIGCLAAYNAGRLHGEWVEVPEDADDLFGEIKRVLAKSPEPGAEEWFFADNEDFHPWRPGEWPDVRKLVLAARLIREEGEAAAIWLGNDDSPLADVDNDDYDGLEERFREQYAGEWDSDEAYARNFVEDCGLPGVGFLRVEVGPWSSRSEQPWSEVLDQLDSLLDWDAVYSHVAEGDIWSSGGHYFRSNG